MILDNTQIYEVVIQHDKDIRDKIDLVTSDNRYLQKNIYLDAPGITIGKIKPENGSVWYQEI